MSALKNLITSLVKVIHGYHDIKTGKTTIDKLQPIDHLLTMSPQELNSTLDKLIEDTAKIQSTRVNFLTYLASIIKDIKFLVDQDEPLSSAEELLVTKVITDLIYHTQQLSPLSHNALFHFQYNKITISAYGFETGYVKITPCTTGDLMRRLFPVPGFTLTSEQYPIIKIQEFVEIMVTEHQSYRLLCQQVNSLKQENTTLTATNHALAQDYRALQLTKKSLQQHLELLQLKRSEERTQASSEEPFAYSPPPSQEPNMLVTLITQAHSFFKKSTSSKEAGRLAEPTIPEMDSPPSKFHSTFGYPNLEID